jgi:hypothetical protein
MDAALPMTCHCPGWTPAATAPSKLELAIKLPSVTMAGGGGGSLLTSSVVSTGSLVVGVSEDVGSSVGVELLDVSTVDVCSVVVSPASGSVSTDASGPMVDSEAVLVSGSLEVVGSSLVSSSSVSSVLSSGLPAPKAS